MEMKTISVQCLAVFSLKNSRQADSRRSSETIAWSGLKKSARGDLSKEKVAAAAKLRLSLDCNPLQGTQGRAAGIHLSFVYFSVTLETVRGNVQVLDALDVVVLVDDDLVKAVLVLLRGDISTSMAVGFGLHHAPLVGLVDLLPDHSPFESSTWPPMTPSTAGQSGKRSSLRIFENQTQRHRSPSTAQFRQGLVQRKPQSSRSRCRTIDVLHDPHDSLFSHA